MNTVNMGDRGLRAARDGVKALPLIQSISRLDWPVTDTIWLLQAVVSPPWYSKPAVSSRPGYLLARLLAVEAERAKSLTISPSVGR